MPKFHLTFIATAALVVVFFGSLLPLRSVAQPTQATATPPRTQAAASRATATITPAVVITATPIATVTVSARATVTATTGEGTDTVTKTVDVTDGETTDGEVTDGDVPTPTVKAGGSPATGTAAVATVDRQALTIHFDDFDAAAELTYPRTGEGPFPTVILIAGSGAEDMDASICSFGGAAPLSQNFRVLAEELPQHGFAVLRYNKHYVTGPCTADFEQYYNNVDLPLLLADAANVLAAAQANELVDPENIFLYGWSEGSTIAGALTISNSDAIAGLVLQAPVTLSWYDTFLYQFANVQLPHLRDLAPDGRIVPQTLLDLVQGNAGLVALGGLSYLADPAVMAQNQLALNPFFDQDADGAIDIDAELLPNLRAYLKQLFEPRGPFAIYAEERALPTVSEQAAQLNVPLLILQGQNDANVPAWGADLLDVLLVGNPDHLLLQYPDLGHSLGKTQSVVADNFAPMDMAPIADLGEWLQQQVQE